MEVAFERLERNISSESSVDTYISPRHSFRGTSAVRCDLVVVVVMGVVVDELRDKVVDASR